MNQTLIRGRRAAVSGMLVAVALTAGACGGGEKAAEQKVSDPRPTTTIPNPTTIPEGGSSGTVSDCGQVVLAYTQLAVTVLEGENAQAKVDSVLAEVRSRVPENLRDDLKVVGDSYARAARAGLLQAGDVLKDPNFRRANRAIGDWLKSTCGSVDLGGN